MVVPYGFSARWKLNLVEPECADPECLSDVFVVWARGRMRAWNRFHQGRIDCCLAHLAPFGAFLSCDARLSGLPGSCVSCWLEQVPGGFLRCLARSPAARQA